MKKLLLFASLGFIQIWAIMPEEERLIDAAERGDTDTMRSMLRTPGLSVSAKSSVQRGFTALHTAAAKGHLGAIDLLLAAGANVNTQNDAGNTPLKTAIIARQPQVIAKLLSIPGVDVNKKNENGYTPLHLASDNGDLQTIQMLLQAGANPNLKNNDSLTAQQLADTRNQPAAANLLSNYTQAPIR